MNLQRTIYVQSNLRPASIQEVSPQLDWDKL